MTQALWPKRLWIVRHGQSAGNVARDAAEAAGLAQIDIATRDVDTPLSSLGEQQAMALGKWFGTLAPDQAPNVVLSSPYVRARHTADLLLAAAGLPRGPMVRVTDERLREKEFGILDRLTRFGIAQKFPELDVQRAHVGKFYFRPPGGESWCDVILRLRNVLETVSRNYAGERVMVVAHQVTVNCLRYLLENLDEEQILGIDRNGDVPNCSITSYQFNPALALHGALGIDQINFVAPLEEAGAPITAAADQPLAAKP